MHTRRLASLLLLPALVLTLGACNKDGQTTETPADATEQGDATPAEGESADAGEGEAEAHEGGEKHEHEFEGAIAEYHDVLSPLWHAEPGDERTTNTCAAVGDFVAKAQAVAAEPTPETASSEESWKAKADALVAASEALGATCEGDRAGFDAGFESLHEAFHGVIEEIGQGH